MGLSVKPIECHGGCLGCYEKAVRDAGTAPAFDGKKVLASLNTQMALDANCSWNSPTLHGGEPLTIPLPDMEALLTAIHGKYGRSGIQTSGAMIRAEHIELFKKYKTCVGISIDGDTAETNLGRWNAPGFDAATMTKQTLDAMRKLKEAGISTSTITVLRKYNAGTPPLRQDLVRFGRRMRDEFGVTSARFNPLIAFDERTAREEELDNDTLAKTFRALAIITFAEDLEWRPMKDFIATLQGKPSECVFSECDPWATEAEIPIMGDGSLGVCMKWADGVVTLRTEKSRARYEMLPQIRQESGGCKGCFWWPYCKGGCPGAGIDGDWRNRSKFCEAYREMFIFTSSLQIFDADRGAIKGGSCGSHGDKAHGDSDDPAWRKANPWWKGEHK